MSAVSNPSRRKGWKTNRKMATYAAVIGLTGLSTLGSTLASANASVPAAMSARTTNVGAVPDSATFGPGITLPAGPYLRAHGETTLHWGPYGTANSAKSDYWCDTYGAYLPGNANLAPSKQLTQFPLKIQQEVQQLIGANGNVSDNTTAAAVNFDLQTLTGGAGFNKPYKGAKLSDRQFTENHFGGPKSKVITLANRLMLNAVNYRGNLIVEVNPVKPAYFGSDVNLTFVESASATGKRVPGNRVAFTVSNGILVGHAPTSFNSNGMATIRVESTSPNHQVGAIASVTAPDTTELLISKPLNKSYQQLISQLPSQTVRASVGVQQARFGAASVNYVCSTSCTGNPQSHVGYVNNTDSVEYLTSSVAGHVLAAVKILPHRSGVDNFNTALDGQTVNISVTVIVAGKAYVVRKDSYLVDCPPVPVITFSGSCPCSGGSLMINPIINASRHLDRVTLSITSGNILVGTSTTSSGTTVTLLIPAGTTSPKITANFTASTEDIIVKTAEQKFSGAWEEQNRLAVQF